MYFVGMFVCGVLELFLVSCDLVVCVIFLVVNVYGVFV